MQRKLLGLINVDSDATGQLLIIQGAAEIPDGFQNEVTH